MTRPRHAPGGRVAGKGLLISFQCGFFRLNATLVTCSGHSPMLQMEIVRSARQQAHTPPKQSEPVTTSRPAGASPLTFTVCGLPGSLLVTVIVPAAGPKPVGAKRIGKSSESPGAISSGNDRTLGHQERAGGRRDSEHGHRAVAAVIEHERLVGEAADADLAEVAAVGDGKAEAGRRRIAGNTDDVR